jgi:hypothetical protein
MLGLTPPVRRLLQLSSDTGITSFPADDDSGAQAEASIEGVTDRGTAIPD